MAETMLGRKVNRNSPAKLESAMREVHNNTPANVTKTGKTGKAKEAMLRAIAFSKAGMSKGK